MKPLPTTPGQTIPAGVPGPAARAAGATFRARSALRGARVFHPRGTGYDATLAITSGWEGVPALAPGSEHRAIVRLSRAAGLPRPLPDALGIGLRLPDVYGRGRHQDFLLVTSARGPVLQHLLLPGLAPGQPYSSLLLYKIGGDVRLVGALPDGERAFRLAVAPLRGGWRPVGELRLGRALPGEYTEQLAFNPWNTGEGIRPIGPLMGLRRAAYRGSQRGRGLTGAQIP
jgi:hypothetical protein